MELAVGAVTQVCTDQLLAPASVRTGGLCARAHTGSTARAAQRLIREYAAPVRLLAFLVAVLLVLLGFLRRRLVLRCLRLGCLLLMLGHRSGWPLRRVLGHRLLGWLRHMRGLRLRSRTLDLSLRTRSMWFALGYRLFWRLLCRLGGRAALLRRDLGGGGPLRVPNCLLRRRSVARCRRALLG